MKNSIHWISFFLATFPPPAVAQIINGQPAIPARENTSIGCVMYFWRCRFCYGMGRIKGCGFGLLQYIAVNEADAVVAFIAERYGEDRVVRFLNALGRAHALDEVIEAALPVSFGEFNRQWLQWIGGG